eukprot:4855735-Amphidinium_carterae.1
MRKRRSTTKVASEGCWCLRTLKVESMYNPLTVGPIYGRHLVACDGQTQTSQVSPPELKQCTMGTKE